MSGSLETDNHDEASPAARVQGPTNPFVRFPKEDIEQSIPSRFQQQVQRYPDRLAVKTTTHELSYAQLDKDSDRVGRALLATMGEPACAVALLLEQSVAAVAAVFGALKAGKPYVPLDPSNPAARIKYILADSQAGLVVTNDKYLALARALVGDKIPILNYDELDATAGSGPPDTCTSPGTCTAPDTCSSPDTLAYIMYTSGSTGHPKGVVDTHRNVLHEIMKYTNDFHICAEDRLTLIRAFTGVGASMDIFTALLNGAALYPLNIQESGLGQLADWIIRQELTIYHSVPTVFRHFVCTLNGSEAFPTLRIVRLGGEVVDRRDLELYKMHFPDDCLLLNLLGTTETLTVRCCFSDKRTQVAGSVLPVGYAMEDVDVLLLDEDRAKVGAGAVGEIAVRGDYLSLGYWRKPELTQAAFIPDPDGGDMRVYLTGDLGRMLPDGCLVHLGRKDFQVKVRGYRVEVAEIELTLLELGAVKEAVVVAYEEASRDVVLTAYLVCAERVSTLALRRFLRERLPDYMIPDRFCQLAALPRTPTGKLDRAALPKQEGPRNESGVPFEAPRTPTECMIADILRRPLAVARVGIHDNFLDLGGNSLMAVKIVYQIKKQMGVTIAPRQLFTQTLAQLAVSCTRQMGDGGSAD